MVLTDLVWFKPVKTSSGRSKPILAILVWFAPIKTGLWPCFRRSGPVETGLMRSKPLLTGQNRFEPVWSGLSRSKLAQVGQNRFEPVGVVGTGQNPFVAQF